MNVAVSPVPETPTMDEEFQIEFVIANEGSVAVDTPFEVEIIIGDKSYEIAVEDSLGAE